MDAMLSPTTQIIYDLFIAHPAQDGVNHQTVKQHLLEVHDLAGLFAKKIGQENAGKLIGLLHDFGKYSQEFQKYMELIIKKEQGFFDPDEDTDPKSLKGRIDHSTAGAQWLYDHIIQKAVKAYPDNNSVEAQLAFAFTQCLFQCIASHHSGLIDSLETANSTGFAKRLQKNYQETHLIECIKAADDEVIQQANELVDSNILEQALRN